jgi:hypothetical protein
MTASTASHAWSAAAPAARARWSSSAGKQQWFSSLRSTSASRRALRLHRARPRRGAASRLPRRGFLRRPCAQGSRCVACQWHPGGLGPGTSARRPSHMLSSTQSLARATARLSDGLPRREPRRSAPLPRSCPSPCRRQPRLGSCGTGPWFASAQGWRRGSGRAACLGAVRVEHSGQWSHRCRRRLGPRGGSPPLARGVLDRSARIVWWRAVTESIRSRPTKPGGRRPTATSCKAGHHDNKQRA